MTKTQCVGINSYFRVNTRYHHFICKHLKFINTVQLDNKNL